MVLDSEILTFIKGSIRSTWALELLLLLRKNAPRAYAPAELVRELRGTAMLIDACLQQLLAVGLVAAENEGAYRYNPATPALDQLCVDLENAYRERPVAVINAIVASPNERLRTFADAFRFNKKDE